MIEVVRSLTPQDLFDELQQINEEGFLYLADGKTDPDMDAVEQDVKSKLDIALNMPQAAPMYMQKFLESVRDVLVEKLWSLHEALLPDTERLFLEDVYHRHGHPIFPRSSDDLVEVTMVVKYKLPGLVLHAGSRVAFDWDEDRKNVVVSSPTGWEAHVPAAYFPRKGMLVNRSGGFDAPPRGRQRNPAICEY